MKIKGYWSKAGWPALYAQVECSYPYANGYVEFALDTGSPFSILSQADAEKLNIRYSKLSLAPRTIVIGGFSGRAYVLKDVSLKPYESRYRELIAEVFVIPPVKELGRALPLPSILGRDFLNRFNVVFKQGQSEIILTDEPIILNP